MEVRVDDQGSLVIVHALDQDAADWITEHVSQDGYQPMFPDSIIVEPRYADDLLFGMFEAGIVVGV